MEISQKLTVNCKIKSKMTVKWAFFGFKMENTVRTMKYGVKWKMDILKTVKSKKPVFKSVKL